MGARVAAQGAARRGAHPRPQRARGADGARVHAARGCAGDREGPALGRRERRDAPGPELERRRPRRLDRVHRRRPDDQALARTSARPCRTDQQAHLPHHDQGRAAPEGDRRAEEPAEARSSEACRRQENRRPRARRRRRPRNGSKSSSRRNARRRHPRLEVQLVDGQEGVPGLPDRGHPHPRAHLQEALARGPVRHPHPQGQAADHRRHLHGTPGHRDRKVGRRGGRAPQGAARHHRQERPHQHQRDQASRARREARRAVDRGAAPEPRRRSVAR